jgi:hypothetical protein
MGDAQRVPSSSILAASLAGLQAGILACLWMLAWLGIGASWQRTSFWAAENLLASTFFGPAAIKSGFSGSTLSGLALYLLIYGSLGCPFAAIFRSRLSRPQLLLAGLLFSVGWYYLSFHGLWKALNPLVTLLHAERPTILGHILYGAMLARYPKYLSAPAVVETPSEHSPVPVVVVSSDDDSSELRGS